MQDYSVEFPEYSRLKEEHMAWKSPIFFCFSDVSLEITQSEEEEKEEKKGEKSFFPAETVPPTRAVSYQEKNKEGSVKV